MMMIIIIIIIVLHFPFTVRIWGNACSLMFGFLIQAITVLDTGHYPGISS